MMNGFITLTILKNVMQVKTVAFLISRIQDANFRLSSESETITI